MYIIIPNIMRRKIWMADDADYIEAIEGTLIDGWGERIRINVGLSSTYEAKLYKALTGQDTVHSYFDIADMPRDDNRVALLLLATDQVYGVWWSEINYQAMLRTAAQLTTGDNLHRDIIYRVNQTANRRSPYYNITTHEILSDALDKMNEARRIQRAQFDQAVVPVNARAAA